VSWQSVGELIVIIWFFFHWPIIIVTVYWILFRQWPLPRGYKWSSDLRLLKSFRNALAQRLYANPEKDAGGPEDYYAEGDYYDDYDGIGTNTGPTVRHPKNRDRAYSGGA